MNNFSIITQKHHPLFINIQQSGIPYHFLNDLPLPKKSQIIIDATLLSDQKKRKVFKHFSSNFIFSDLSINWGELLMKQFPNVVAGLSLGIWSPKNAIEACCPGDEYKIQVEQFLSILQLKPIFVSSAGICFHYPRVLAMLINEAYFLVESNLSDNKSINLSMQYGANYPLGLLDWGEKIGLKNILKILRTLHKIDPSGRYIPSKQLLRDK